MPYATRLQPGCYYHIYNRGNNRENIFVENRNYPYFLSLYAKHVAPHVDTLAYCLLRNHFHLLIRVKDDAEQRPERFKRSGRSLDDLDATTRGFTSLFSAYAMAINKATRRRGKLFQEHFGRIQVTSDEYLTNLVFYIHFNPQKHGFVTDFRRWPWSSYRGLRSSAPTQLAREHVLAFFGGADAMAKFHQGAVDERLIASMIGEVGLKSIKRPERSKRSGRFCSFKIPRTLGDADIGHWTIDSICGLS